MRRLAVLVATGFGLGRLPWVPATWASFAVAALLAPFLGSLDPWILPAAAVLLTPVAIAASGEAERTLGHDARPIVIDEVVGMLVGLIGVPVAGDPAGVILLLAMAFVLFRVFDIWKPFPVRASQKLPGGYGVVVDDILAGLYTNVALRILVSTLVVFDRGLSR